MRSKLPSLAWGHTILLDGSIDRYNSRLIAKGYNHIEGIDYFDSLSPVAKVVTVCIFIAIAAAYSWPLLQLDVNNTFLQGHFDVEVYIFPPEGYSKAADGLSLVVYVDNVLLTGNSMEAIDAVKLYLDNLFTIKDLGFAKYFLELKLARFSHGTYVSQCKYLLNIVRDCHLTDAKLAATPLPTSIKLDVVSGSLFAAPAHFKRLVGRFLYLAFSRPEIFFVV
ncbi:uncharacterized protein LOC110012401 [Sesamum indicum]|uniref:Uncharacterized protein LOC110012401 n=1 Tax=Sesamum indicum TaxID=4182 RepID=A0A8M8UYJ2_SESIN|nr:uncharacterized protein LOC110012401 [Sesamum indicum]